jgi:RNA polymerase sigma-70 factor (ECF subfamily)
MPTAAVSSGPGAALSKAFEELFREHYQLIYRTAFSVTGRRQDAEDVLQTIFLRLLQRGLPPDFSRNPKGYLYRAAINLSLNTVRARKRESATDSMERLLAPVAPVAAGQDRQDHGLRGHLLDAIAQLNPRAVEMLVLRYEHGYSDAGIAAMLGKSRGTVAVTLYRTRARLKKLLSRETSGGRP